jgi:uncharacterized repeat protein (TIGR01451 family)
MAILKKLATPSLLENSRGAIIKISFAAAGCLSLLTMATTVSAQEEQSGFVMNQGSIPVQEIEPVADPNTQPLPAYPPIVQPKPKAEHHASAAVYDADFGQDTDFTERMGFTIQDGELAEQNSFGIYPVPMGREARQDDPRYRHKTDPRATNNEYIYDGSDRGKRVQVDGDWNIYGMDTEDTFGHFDTVDGKRLVSPSNRVAIYAPRFSAVRRVDELFKAQLNTQITELEEKVPLSVARGKDFSTTTKQNVMLEHQQGSKRASAFLDQTRGVIQGQVVELFGVRNSFKPYENLELIKWGRASSAEMARLSLGIQSANVWQDNLGLQVTADRIQPVVVNDASRVQQMVIVETNDDNSILRVTKIASKIAARSGEEVEFTIRFDNLSPNKVGNVTLVDNLTGRLQYVPDSAECSVKAKFIHDPNSGGSLMLRWEVEAPLEPHEGGVIRFRCKVR